MVGVSIEAGVWRVASGVDIASDLHGSTMRGGMNRDSVCCVAGFCDLGKGKMRGGSGEMRGFFPFDKLRVRMTRLFFGAALKMIQVVQISRMPGPNFSIFSWPRPWMVFSWER